MSDFEPGDRVFHPGSWEPVTILGYDYIHDGVGGSMEGYKITMRGWSEPQVQGKLGFLTYRQNVKYMENVLHSGLGDLHYFALRVTTDKQNLDRLLNWGEKNQGVAAIRNDVGDMTKGEDHG